MYGTILKQNDILRENPHKSMCVIRNLLGNLILFIFTKIHHCRIVLVNVTLNISSSRVQKLFQATLEFVRSCLYDPHISI